RDDSDDGLLTRASLRSIVRIDTRTPAGCWSRKISARRGFGTSERLFYHFHPPRAGLPKTVMSYRDTEHLRVLIANERKDRLALVAAAVVVLGHEVIAREVEVEDVAAVTARERPDVALV